MTWLRCFGVVACLAISPAAFAQRGSLPPATITVSGEASIEVVPDLALIRVGAVSQGKSAREASEANGKLMNAVTAAAKDGGIADADLQTARVTLQPVYAPDRSPQSRVTGFQASNQLLLKLRNVSRIADILDRLVAAGANDIGGFEFTVSAPEKALDKVRADAIAEARRKADIYARAAGVELGRPLTIAEDSAASPVVVRSAAPAMKIAPGEKTLTISVTVTYELVR